MGAQDAMGKKILLADDSITIQKVIELTFSDEDFDVVTVGNGRLALEKLAEVRPDIVLCDIIMPEKDGYEVCEQIKKNPTLLARAGPAADRGVRALRPGARGPRGLRRLPREAVRARDAHREGQGPAGAGAGAPPRPPPPPVVPFARPAALVPPPGRVPPAVVPPPPRPVALAPVAEAPAFIPDEPFDAVRPSRRRSRRHRRSRQRHRRSRR